MNMVKNPPEGSPRILARLAYDDADQAVAFLREAFGFHELEEARVVDGDGIALTEITVVDSKIMIGRAGAHGLASPQRFGGYTQALIVFVDDVDGHFARAKAAGANIVSEPEDQFWGDRRYEALDPEGHLWSFHEHIRDVSREEMSEILRSFSKDNG